MFCGLAVSSEDEIAMTKLEYLRELRDVTFDLNSLKARLRQEIETMNNEKNCLSIYQKEKELLEQEKMAHVDELRLVHSDLHQMESVIKESEQEHNNHLNSAKSLFLEWQQMKEHANKMRSGLGLDHLAELSDEEHKIKDELLKEQWITDHIHPTSEINHSNIRMNKPMLPVNSHSYPFPPSSTGMKNFKSNYDTPRTNPMACPVPHQFSSSPENSMPERQNPMAFRQQPPPMKECGTCKQQIHRNAPICPLCKAKSRSQHVKSSKKQRRKGE